jgi:HEAT repeat protein
MLVWAVVAGLLMLRLGAGAQAVERLVRQARPANERWRERLRELDARPGRRAVRLLVHGDIAMPMTWGARRPVILLPSEALQWTDDRARIVLLHELAHIRRMDGITQALAGLLAALHWFNPLAWAAVRAMARERERACDDLVLAHGAQPSSYAQHLLDIARAGVEGRTYALAPAMARASELEGRLLSILTPRRRDPRRGASLLCAAAAAVVTVAVASAAPRTLPPPSIPPVVTAAASAAPPSDWMFLNDDSHEQKREAGRARAALVPLAAAATRSDSEDTREKATMALALRSEPGVVEPLIRALHDPSGQVREKAAIGLAFRRDPRAVPALLEAMDDSDSQVREKAAVALGLSGDARAVDALTRALADPDEQVREKAAGALAMFDSPLSRALTGSGAAGALADTIRDGIAGAVAPYLERRPR